ncbi:fumarate hydratase [[Eubacterium] cellulosolvens]
MITRDLIETATVELLQRAQTVLPTDIVTALQKAHDEETDDLPKTQLKNILENIRLAKESNIPMCQDTGVQIFFVHLPKETNMLSLPAISDGIHSGVIRATEKVPLRPNTVHPLTRANPGNNTGEHMPYINFKPSNNEYLELVVMPKGAGSENMSALSMLTPAQGIKGIKKFVLDTLIHAGGKPCPPIILGVGIGGSADISIKLAKEALLRPIDQHHPDPQLAALEQELYEALNGIGIGPMGLGGKTTLLGINIEYAHCHTASHPVAVNIQCWAARRARAKIFPDSKIEYGQ